MFALPLKAIDQCLRHTRNYLVVACHDFRMWKRPYENLSSISSHLSKFRVGKVKRTLGGFFYIWGALLSG